MSQLSLGYSPQWRCQESWQHLLVECRKAVDFVSLKQAAYDLDTSPSRLAHSLAERDRHYLRAEWVPYLIMQAPTDRPVEILADLRGATLAPKVELTPEQQLDRLKRALGELLGDDIRDAIYSRAWG